MDQEQDARWLYRDRLAQRAISRAVIALVATSAAAVAVEAGGWGFVWVLLAVSVLLVGWAGWQVRQLWKAST